MGFLLAIEGVDGTGKGTQAALLQNWLLGLGLESNLLSFPRYADTEAGTAIGKYLNGEFGSMDTVHPYLAARLFADDRRQSKQLMASLAAGHNMLVLDRYVDSNVAHQAAKYTDREQQLDMLSLINRLEYGENKLEIPDLTILLDAPIEVCLERIAQKAMRDYTTKKADLHEADATYLARVRHVYLQLRAMTPNTYVLINSTQSIDQVARDVAAAVTVWLKQIDLWPKAQPAN